MEESRGICGIRKSGRHDHVWREQAGHPLPDGSTRSGGKSVLRETVRTSGACQKNLRADDQVWRILGEFAVFDKVVDMIKYGARRGDSLFTTQGRGASGPAV